MTAGEHPGCGIEKLTGDPSSASRFPAPKEPDRHSASRGRNLLVKSETQNIWPELAKLSYPENEVFVVISLLGGGAMAGASATNRRTVGRPPQYEIGRTVKGNRWGSLYGASSTSIEDLKAELTIHLAKQPKWTSFAMAGRFDQAGTFVTDRLQMQPAGDLLRLPLNSSLLEPDAFTGIETAMNAVRVDVQYSGAENSLVDMMRFRIERQRAADLVTLCTWFPLTDPNSPADEQWNYVWDRQSLSFNHAVLQPGIYLEQGDPEDQPKIAGELSFDRVEHSRFAGGPVDLPRHRL